MTHIVKIILLSSLIQYAFANFSDEYGSYDINPTTIAQTEYQNSQNLKWGKNCESDWENAIKYLNLSSAHGYGLASHELAWHYFEGNCVTQNHNTARILFERASKQGFSKAAEILKDYKELSGNMLKFYNSSIKVNG